METLFSTVAQISFTIVGLFFVALTVDSDSRKFWFGQKPQIRYITISLLVMLFPGFVSLAGLLPPVYGSFPAWPVIMVFLLIVYAVLYRQLLAIKKLSEFQQLVRYEERLDVVATTKSNIWILIILPVIGLVSLFSSNEKLITLTNFLFGFVAFCSVITSILPVNGILRAQAENTKGTDPIRVVEIGKESSIGENSKQDQAISGFFSLVAMAVVVIAFLVGRFFNKD